MLAGELRVGGDLAVAVGAVAGPQTCSAVCFALAISGWAAALSWA